MVNQQDLHRVIRSLEVQDRRSDDLTLRMEDLESLVVLQSFLVGDKLAVNVDSTTVAVGDGHISNDLRVGGGLHVGSLGTDPPADDIKADGNITGNKIISSNDVVAGGGLYAGSVGGSPATGDVIATADGRFGGGLWVGSTSSNPGADNAIIDGGLGVGSIGEVTTPGRAKFSENVYVGTGLHVGDTSTTPTDDSISVIAGTRLGGAARVQGTAFPTGSGGGGELSWQSTYARLLSYSRPSGPDQPLQLRGSIVTLNESGTDVWRINAGAMQVYKNSAWNTVYGIHMYTTAKTHTSWDGDDKSNTEVTFTLTNWGLPNNIHAVYASISVESSSLSPASQYVVMGNVTAKWTLASRPQVVGIVNDESGWVPCDGNGDVTVKVVGPTTGTFNGWISFWGYAI